VFAGVNACMANQECSLLESTRPHLHAGLDAQQQLSRVTSAKVKMFLCVPGVVPLRRIESGDALTYRHGPQRLCWFRRILPVKFTNSNLRLKCVLLMNMIKATSHRSDIVSAGMTKFFTQPLPA
jgi:hypothetical protein